jgi:phenylpropionate dioxygenase-like ring-hydroxylating dioxygenase large terminal subunit
MLELSNSRFSEANDRRAEGRARRGYHQSWYPLTLSSELVAGKVIGKDFLGTRVILYRGSAGQALVLAACLQADRQA